MNPITFGILTVSDTRYEKNNIKDESGLEAERFVSDGMGGKICRKEIVPDDEHIIMKTLIEWSDKDKINVILTSGGTGFSKRDVTPEATKRIIEKEAPGIVTAMLNKSLEVTPMAMLSRAVCGIRGQTLIVNLPGSPKAVGECLSVIAPVLPHAVSLIVGDDSKVREHHKSIQNCGHLAQKHKTLATTLGNVADRMRQSPYPMISLEEAKKILTEQISLGNNSEDKTALTDHVDLRNSHGRILAEAIYSQCNLPPFRASIKDGYAVIADDGAGPRKVSSGVEAGDEPGAVHLRRGECVRVNTGAPIPDEATAVVQVEDTVLLSRDETKTKERMIDILVPPKIGQDIRNVGSDMKKGSLVLREGSRIGPAEIGILAACGISKVPVVRTPVVGILSTGNELQTPGELPKPGHVYDSNKITLIAILKESGYDSMDFKIVRDDFQEMVTLIATALSVVDVLITTGSVSMGDKDMLKPILKENFNASIHFGRVSLKPGKPTTFATCEYEGKRKYILCLPGNPVSAMVTANIFAVPLLHGLSLNDSKPTIVTAKIMVDYDLDPRPEYVRAILEWKDEDVPEACVTGNQISSRLLSCKSANAFLILPGKTETKSKMFKGDKVSAMLIGF